MEVATRVLERVGRDGYDELRVALDVSKRDSIPAFLLLPHRSGPGPGVLVHHQHASQWHLGKSEVVGRTGDPQQAFGPTLARRGMVVLAPDSLCFEDRRPHATGTEPGVGRSDWEFHYQEMSRRLVVGQTLMHAVLTDAMAASSALAQLPETQGQRIGTLGHSSGGNTVLFHAALDMRVEFVCASGAACSYRWPGPPISTRVTRKR